MKKIVCGLLFCWVACFNLYAQEETSEQVLEEASMPVFVIRNRGLAAVFDDFIDKAKGINRSGTIFGVSFTMFDIDSKDKVDICIYAVRPPEPQDSLTLYIPRDFQWAFIRHRDILFRVQFYSYTTSFNYYLLTDMLKKLPQKQKIYLKNPPPDYYPRPVYEYPELLLAEMYDYNGEEWYYGIRVWIDEDYEIIELNQ